MIFYVEEKMHYFKAIPESRAGPNGWKCKDTILLQPEESPAGRRSQALAEQFTRGVMLLLEVAHRSWLPHQEKLQVPFPPRGMDAHTEFGSTLPGSSSSLIV